MAIGLKRLTPKQLDDLARQIEAHKSERTSYHIAVVHAKAAELARAAGLTLQTCSLCPDRNDAERSH